MASYYYLLSSLPDLKSDSELPMTYEEFLDACEPEMSKKRFELLQNLSLDSEEGPLVKEWAESYKVLMQELNYQRSMILNKSYKNPDDKDADVSKVVADALSAKNPLEAERILLNYQFDLLDSLTGLSMFDDTVLFGYALKLKLLERQSCFEQKKGQKEFSRLFDQVQQRVYSL